MVARDAAAKLEAAVKLEAAAKLERDATQGLVISPFGSQNTAVA